MTKDTIPKVVKPTESAFHECFRPLAGPFCITYHARVLTTMQGMTEGVDTLFRIWYICNNYYQYQEYHHGLHNYHDVLFPRLDVCLFLRAGKHQKSCRCWYDFFNP